MLWVQLLIKYSSFVQTLWFFLFVLLKKIHVYQMFDQNICIPSCLKTTRNEIVVRVSHCMYYHLVATVNQDVQFFFSST